MAASSLPVRAVAGVRLAVEPGAGRTTVAVGAAMGGAVVTVAALAAAVVFGTGLQSLVGHPRQYGWDWDLTVVDLSGYGNIDLARSHQLLDHDRDVTAWSAVSFGSVSIDGRNVPALGVDPGAAVLPPLLFGHQVSGADDVVAGTVTLAAIHRRVGDAVAIGKGSFPARPRRFPFSGRPRW